MPIIYHEESREFHLYNKEVSYLFTILKNGQLGQLYYGKRLHDKESFCNLLEFGKKDMAPCSFWGDRTFSLEYLKQEYPTFGSGDLRYPAYQIEQTNGSIITDFVYQSHRIIKGAPKLSGLPAVYCLDEMEADTLEVVLEDAKIQTKLVLSYTIFVDRPVILRSSQIRYEGKESIRLTTAMSFCLDLYDSNYEMVDLAGAWARERYVSSHKLHEGVQSIYSMRGHSSHQFNPFMALKRSECNEVSGEVLGFALIYSGNFEAMVNTDTFSVSRVMMGIHPNDFSWTLNPQETFQTPEAVLVYTDQGMNAMSQVFHSLFRERLVRGYWKEKMRPILINNWEATFMNFDQEKLLSIACKASELGVEMMVLDDGWFGHRNDDTTSLGDWTVDLKKLPEGIKGIAQKIEALGMKFGLWIEPEMISMDSELYRNHPDWVLSEPGRKRCHGRNQYVLDYTRDEVVDCIYEQISNILKNAPVSYIKWDMNRSISEPYSIKLDSKRQGEVFHRQVLGVYKLYERLIASFPKVLFESCASGGARYDPGMLYYAPQTWTSDNTDAMERIRIQYGTSLLYPLSSMGCHVSKSPNQQTNRCISLKTRGDVAYFGVFGYELDLNELTKEEQSQVVMQIKFVKRYQHLIMTGDFYRLLSPFEGDEAAWMVVSSDQKLALVGYYRMRQPSNAPYQRLKLQGLNKDVCYQIEGVQGEFYGDELMYAGLVISDQAAGVVTAKEIQGDYQSRIYLLQQTNH